MSHTDLMNERVLRLLEDQQRAIAIVAAELDGVRRRHLDELQNLRQRLEELKAWVHEAPVLVRRTPGGYDRIYHYGLRPCRLVRRRENFEELFLTQAEALRIRPCYSCGARAWRHADRPRAAW